MKLALLALAATTAHAACPNSCSGHGTCGADDTCTCYQDWVMGDQDGGDCSDRRCPYQVAWSAGPDKTGNIHTYAECAGVGICDRGSGDCECFEGYTGSGCGLQTCPNDCSGHGECVYAEDVTFGTVWGDYNVDAPSGGLGVGAHYPQLRCYVQFTGSSVAGPQYLLEVEADKCDSGCTPQLSNPVRLKSALRPSTEVACLYPDEDKVCSTAFWSMAGYGFVGTAGIDNSATTLPVTDGADFGGDSTCPFSSCGYIQVGSEIMELTAVAGTDLTVVRGQEGTTAAAHADGDMVYWLGAKVDGVHPDILSSVFEAEEADYNSFECGRRGKCDYSSGECECFEGYVGDRCQTQTALI